MKTIESGSKDLLMFLGRAFSQAMLYGNGHPSVGKCLKDANQILEEIFVSSNLDEIVFSLDHERLLVNGHNVGTLKEQGAGIRALFINYKLHSLSLLRGLPTEEFKTLAGIFQENTKDIKDFNLGLWLEQKGIRSIKSNEAFYVKVEKEEDAIIKESGSRADKGGSLSSITLSGQDGEKPPETPPEAMEEQPQEAPQQLKQTNKILAAEVARLQNEIRRAYGILSHLFSGFIIVDNSGQILSLDATAENLMRATSREVSGQRLADIVEPALHVLSLSAQLGTLSSKEENPGVLMRADPALRNAIQASAVLVINEAQRLVGLLVSPQEIVKLREYENLKKKILSTIAAVLNSSAEPLTKGLDRIKSEVGPKLSVDHQRFLEHLISRQEILTRAIKEIADFAAISKEELKVYRVNVPVYSVVQEAVDSLAFWAKEREVTFEYDFAKELPQVQCDPKKSAEVIRHLLSNAVRNSPPQGKVKISVVRGSDLEEQYIQITIADQGRGLTSLEQEAAMKEFVRLDSEGELGLGLGLNLSKALVELQKGKFWMGSEPGKGTTVGFTLPISLTPSEYKAQAAPQAVIQRAKPWWQKLLERLGLKFS